MSLSTIPVAEAAVRPGGWSLHLSLAIAIAGVMVLAMAVAALLLFGRFVPAVSMFETRHDESEAEAARAQR